MSNDPVASSADWHLRGAVEALLLASDAPLTSRALSHVTDHDEDQVSEALASLGQDCAVSGRGVELRQTDLGWQLFTSVQYADVVERMLREGSGARFTQAGLETLAIVAYLAPTSRSRVASIRGVNSDSAVRTLMGRGLIEEQVGSTLLVTTAQFRERVGLDDQALPELSQYLPDIESIMTQIDQLESEE